MLLEAVQRALNGMMPTRGHAFVKHCESVTKWAVALMMPILLDMLCTGSGGWACRTRHALGQTAHYHQALQHFLVLGQHGVQ